MGSPSIIMTYIITGFLRLPITSFLSVGIWKSAKQHKTQWKKITAQIFITFAFIATLINLEEHINHLESLIQYGFFDAMNYPNGIQ